MEMNVSTDAVPLGEIYEAQENAHACVAVEEFGQAIECFSNALLLIPSSSSWSSGATSPSGSRDPTHALSTTLMLERADCYLRLRQFDQAMDDADTVLSTSGRNIKAKRIKCEALFALKQERPALKLWTNVLLETGDSPEMELLRKKHPVAAVHVLHAVKLAEPMVKEPKPVDEAKPTTAFFPEGPNGHNGFVASSGATQANVEANRGVATLTYDLAALTIDPTPTKKIQPLDERKPPASSVTSGVADAEAFSPFLHLGAAMLHQSNTIVPNEPSRHTPRAVPSPEPLDDDFACFYDPVFTTLPTENAVVVLETKAQRPVTIPTSVKTDATASRSPLSSPTSPTGSGSDGSASMVFVDAPPDCSGSMVLIDKPPTSSTPPTPVPLGIPTTANSSPPARAPRRVSADKAELERMLQLAHDGVARKDFATVLHHIDDAMDTRWLPSLLYERALCIDAMPSFSVADKIGALSEYVAQNPLDAEWMPHAFYMLSSHYLELHEFEDAARMRFLAEECEVLRARVATFPPVAGAPAFSRKSEVENAFAPPWLVLSYEDQRRCVESGSLACRACPPNAAPVPLMQYVKHRTTTCPGLAVRETTNKPT